MYSIFKEYLIDTVAHIILRRGWENHFPHFNYDLHAGEVATIYSEALEKEIPHKELQLYILERLVQEKSKSTPSPSLCFTCTLRADTENDITS